MTSPVAVIESACAVRHSLLFALESAGHEVLTFSSAELFLKFADARAVGCLLADLQMPRMSGIELLNHCRSRHLDVPVILITAKAKLDIAVEAMKAGAADVIEMPCDDGRVLAAVRIAGSRQRNAGTDTDVRRISPRLTVLSDRERDVLACMLAGNPNKTIATELGISVRTVEVHRGRVITKMGARNAADVVRMVMSATGAA
jgi:two-component system, LuxR family, response regulator FixJ